MNANVVRDYDWTTVAKGSSLRTKAPKVYVRAFKFKSSEALNRISSYVKATASQNPEEYYQKLYGDAVTPDGVFVFPYFSDMVRSFTNTYGDTFNMQSLGALDSMINGIVSEGAGVTSQLGGDKMLDNLKTAGGNVGTAMASLVKGDYGQAFKDLGANMSNAPGTNVETPKLYQYEQSDSPVEVTFILSNTISKNGVEDNHKLIKHLTRINRPKRTSYVYMEPPRIYEIKIPGLRFIKWASCSNFSVRMLGAKREIDGILVPEGYEISMSFCSLTLEVENFMDNVGL